MGARSFDSAAILLSLLPAATNKLNASSEIWLRVLLNSFNTVGIIKLAAANPFSVTLPRSAALIKLSPLRS